MPMIHHVRGDASEQEAPDGAARVAADDDEVGTFRIGSVDHGRARVAFPDEELGSDAELPRVRDCAGQRRLAPCSDVVDARVKEAAR